jgi:hypothetical protein
MPDPHIEQRQIVVIREVVAGTSLVAACGFAAAVLFADPAGRALVIAVCCAVCAACSTDWLARTSIGALAALIYVMFLAQQSAVTTPWPTHRSSAWQRC